MNVSGNQPGTLVDKSVLKRNRLQDFSILIVDDEPDLLEILAFDLERIGYQVETASGGNEALKKYHHQAYDLIITDIRMPDGDGLSLLKNIKSINSTTPIVCITGFSDMPTSHIMDLGAYAVFEKPFSSKKLQTVLLKALGLTIEP